MESLKEWYDIIQKNEDILNAYTDAEKQFKSMNTSKFAYEANGHPWHVGKFKHYTDDECRLIIENYNTRKKDMQNRLSTYEINEYTKKYMESSYTQLQSVTNNLFAAL